MTIGGNFADFLCSARLVPTSFGGKFLHYFLYFITAFNRLYEKNTLRHVIWYICIFSIFYLSNFMIKEVMTLFITKIYAWFCVFTLIDCGKGQI